MRFSRLSPEALKAVGDSGMFAVGVRVTQRWVWPVLALAGYQVAVNRYHALTLIERLKPLKRAMRAGDARRLVHVCGGIFTHYMAHFTVHELNGLPRCTLAGWTGKRKWFTITLGWRDILTFEAALRQLVQMADEAVRGARGQVDTAGVDRRTNRAPGVFRKRR